MPGALVEKVLAVVREVVVALSALVLEVHQYQSAQQVETHTALDDVT